MTKPLKQLAKNSLFKAWAASDAVECHRLLKREWPKRNIKKIHVGLLLSTIKLTEYWRELGASSWKDYLIKEVGDKWEEADGLAVAAQYKDIPEIVKFIRTGMISPVSLSIVQDVMNAGTILRWIPLMVHLKEKELRQTVNQFRAVSRSRHVGSCVFVPLFVPFKWYAENWTPLLSACKGHKARPAFDVLLDLLKKERER